MTDQPICKRPSGIWSRLNGIVIATMGVVLAALGLTVSCPCGVSPVPLLLGAGGILAGFFVFGKWPIIAVGVICIVIGAYVLYAKKKKN